MQFFARPSASCMLGCLQLEAGLLTRQQGRLRRARRLALKSKGENKTLKYLNKLTNYISILIL